MPRKKFAEYLKEISKEDLVVYYVNENHIQQEVLEKFNISNLDMLHQILLHYNIDKPKPLTNIRIKEKLSLKSDKTNKETKSFNIKKSNSLKEHYKNMNEEDRKSQNAHISAYFTKATPEQLNQRRLKKMDSLNKKTCEEKIDSYSKNLISRDMNPSSLFLSLRFDKEATLKYLEENPSTYNELAQKFNVTYACLTNWLEENQLNKYLKNEKSNYELQIGNYLDELGIPYVRNNRKIIPPQELDFYIPDKKIAIEFNGNYWHSTINIKDKNYHLNKSKLCEEKGIRLIHIWEYEWDDETQREKIKQLLRIALGKVETRIYARNCEIKEISNKEASILNNKIHLQNHRNAQVTYGLYYKDELVQLMSFSKTRYNRNLKKEGSWEIIRGCPGSNNIVVGGVSRLFKHFVKEQNPEEVFSYCDFNKFNGVSYEKLGMQFIGYTGPDLSYFMGKEVRRRNPAQYRYNKENCVGRIWGVGSKKYLWINK